METTPIKKIKDVIYLLKYHGVCGLDAINVIISILLEEIPKNIAPEIIQQINTILGTNKNFYNFGDIIETFNMIDSKNIGNKKGSGLG